MYATSSACSISKAPDRGGAEAATVSPKATQLLAVARAWIDPRDDIGNWARDTIAAHEGGARYRLRDSLYPTALRTPASLAMARDILQHGQDGSEWDFVRKAYIPILNDPTDYARCIVCIVDAMKACAVPLADRTISLLLQVWQTVIDSVPALRSSEASDIIASADARHSPGTRRICLDVIVSAVYRSKEGKFDVSEFMPMIAMSKFQESHVAGDEVIHLDGVVVIIDTALSGNMDYSPIVMLVKLSKGNMSLRPPPSYVLVESSAAILIPCGDGGLHQSWDIANQEPGFQAMASAEKLLVENALKSTGAYRFFNEGRTQTGDSWGPRGSSVFTSCIQNAIVIAAPNFKYHTNGSPLLTQVLAALSGGSPISVDEMTLSIAMNKAAADLNGVDCADTDVRNLIYAIGDDGDDSASQASSSHENMIGQDGLDAWLDLDDLDPFDAYESGLSGFGAEIQFALDDAGLGASSETIEVCQRSDQEGFGCGNNQLIDQAPPDPFHDLNLTDLDDCGDYEYYHSDYGSGGGSYYSESSLSPNEESDDGGSLRGVSTPAMSI